MHNQPGILLNDGNTIPQLGFGVWQTPADDTARAVGAALKTGYRHIDTAAIYGNEAGVGDAVRHSGLDRRQIFVTTKLWNDNQGFDATLSAFDRSMKTLGLDYIDLYLIHWPAPKRGLYLETWRAFIRLKEEGRIHSIGVSNFCESHLRELVDATGIVPVLNQVELHPKFQQKALRAAHDALGIATEAWSPLGQGKLLQDPVLTGIAGRLGRSPAQVIIRWHLDNGTIAIPKSVTPGRIAENFNVFDFTLDPADRALIDGLDDVGGRIGPDPMTASF